VGGVLFAYGATSPRSRLDDYRPKNHAHPRRNGDVIGGSPPSGGWSWLRRHRARAAQAIIATEDADFEQHFGLSISRILMTARRRRVSARAPAPSRSGWPGISFARPIRAGRLRRCSGARWESSPVTQRLHNLSAEDSAEAAAQLTSAKISFRMEAGARMYFNKSAKDVTLDEAATIAAIIQTPARLSPFVNPERTLARRNNYVLPRMAEEGFVTRQAAIEAAQKPIVVRGQAAAAAERSMAAYFVEDIRKNLEQRFGAAALYETGLQVQTTLDVELQRAAERAVDRGLRRLDKRRSGYRKVKENVAAAKATPQTYASPRWTQSLRRARARRRDVAAEDTGRRARIRIASTELTCRARLPDPKPTPRSLYRRRHRGGGWRREKGRFTQSPWSSRPSSKGRSWRSTTAPGRSAPWSAASTSPAASSTAPPRRAGRSARCSNRCSTPPRSTAASPPRRSSSTSRCRTTRARTSPPTGL
jgi:hypothetical protein